MASLHDLEQHRAALTGHCYRMMGSAADADDAVQETMVRAWRGLGRFEERASLRTWLTRIATRVCLDALTDRTRRLRPIELEGPGTVDDPLTELPRGRWIEPIPDQVALPADADPLERVSLRQSIRLAFVAALQHLPPKQRLGRSRHDADERQEVRVDLVLVGRAQAVRRALVGLQLRSMGAECSRATVIVLITLLLLKTMVRRPAPYPGSRAADHWQERNP